MLKYGFSPFAEFTRSLNNAGQKLTLTDGFGNVIDEVAYSNAAPWPNADGNGNYLKLTNVSLDNNIGTNWVASTSTISTTITATEEYDMIPLDVYPNPTENSVNVKTSSMITALQLRDLQGRLLETIPSNSNFISFSMSPYANGLYLLTITAKGKTIVRKVSKK